MTDSGGLARAISRIAVPVVVILAMWCFRRFVPAENPQSSEETSFSEAEAAEFKKMSGMMAIAIFAMIVVAGFAIYEMLVQTNRQWAAASGPADMVLFPQQAIWSFLPGFAGLCFGWEIVLWLWCRFGDARRAKKYEAWSNAKYGMNGTKILRWMGLLIALPIGVLTALALPMHCSLGPNAIRVRRYATLSTEVYRYTDARRLVIVDGYRDREGKLNKEPGLILDFNDGRRWDSRDGTEIYQSLDAKLLEYVQAKTKLKPEHCLTAKEIPPPQDSQK